MRKRSNEQVRRRQRGVVMAELTIILPVLLIIMLGLVDLGRLLYAHQIMTDLTREAANLVSRGSSAAEAYVASDLVEGPVQVSQNGGMIISTVTRRDIDDATPWIVQQVRKGPMGGVASRFGTDNGPAELPNIDEMEPGITLMAVEIVHPFAPVFGIADFGLDFYPEILYDAAVF